MDAVELTVTYAIAYMWGDSGVSPGGGDSATVAETCAGALPDGKSKCPLTGGTTLFPIPTPPLAKYTGNVPPIKLPD